MVKGIAIYGVKNLRDTFNFSPAKPRSLPCAAT